MNQELRLASCNNSQVASQQYDWQPERQSIPALCIMCRSIRWCQWCVIMFFLW